MRTRRFRAASALDTLLESDTMHWLLALDSTVSACSAMNRFRRASHLVCREGTTRREPIRRNRNLSKLWLDHACKDCCRISGRKLTERNSTTSMRSKDAFFVNRYGLVVPRSWLIGNAFPQSGSVLPDPKGTVIKSTLAKSFFVPSWLPYYA